MNYRSNIGKGGGAFSSLVGVTLSIAGLMLAFFASNLVHAQQGPMDSPVPGQLFG